MNNERITAFYDGQCGLCHMAVVFLLKRDRQGKIFFAPIQSEFYRVFADEKKLSLTPRSILVYKVAEGRMLTESAAVFYLLMYCGRFWQITVGLCDMIPLSFWNTLYRFIARIRHRLFAKPVSLVPNLPPDLMMRIRT